MRITRNHLLLVAGAALLLTGFWLLGRTVAPQVLGLAARWQGAGAAGAALFALVYLTATVALIPGSLLSLAAGAIFGVWRGTAIVMVGATAGAALAFLIARFLARPLVTRRIARDPRFVRMDRAIGRSGLRLVLLLRLSPLFPFVLLNYALGITDVRLRDFLIGSVGMLPGALLYVYSGRVIGDVAAVASGVAPGRGPGHYVVLGIGLVATLLVARHATRVAGAALAAETGLEEAHDG